MINQLTFTRFLAAIAIVIFHYGAAIYPFSNETIGFLVKQANMGVSYFFVLSGFIMVIAYGNRNEIDFKDYLKNRFARIYPLVFLSILPFFAIALKAERVSYGDVFLNLTTLQSWIPGKATAGNYPLWSITVEIFFYLCFPWLFNKVYKKFSLRYIAIMVVCILVVSISLQHYFLYSGVVNTEDPAVYDLLYYFPPMHLGQFLTGNVAGLLYLKSREGKYNYDVLVILAIAVLVVLLKLELLNYHNGVLAPLFAVVIYLMAKNTGVITKVFNNKKLVFLGEISFAVYVLQAPVFTIVKLACQIVFKVSGEDALTFYMSMVSLLLASALAHIYVEKPMRNRIKAFRFSLSANK